VRNLAKRKSDREKSLSENGAIIVKSDCDEYPELR
jgi:hypothetical protein